MHPLCLHWLPTRCSLPCLFCITPLLVGLSVAGAAADTRLHANALGASAAADSLTGKTPGDLARAGADVKHSSSWAKPSTSSWAWPKLVCLSYGLASCVASREVLPHCLIHGLLLLLLVLLDLLPTPHS